MEKKYGEYSYQVSAVYEHCNESEKSEVIIIIVGINDFQISSYSIYPNPTSGNVTFEGIGLSRVELYDAQGRKLAEYNVLNEKLQINMSKYGNGVYFVRIHSNANNVVVKRLVVIK